MHTDHIMQDQPENVVTCGLIDSTVRYNGIIIDIICNWHKITGNMSIFIVIAGPPSCKNHITCTKAHAATSGSRYYTYNNCWLININHSFEWRRWHEECSDRIAHELYEWSWKKKNQLNRTSSFLEDSKRNSNSKD